MKKGLLLLSAIIVSLTAFGQDLITTTEGQTIKAKVLEVGLDEIKYKKHENLEGPTYTMVKSKVLVIYYENGTTELFGNQDRAIPSAEPAKSASSPTEKDSSWKGSFSYRIGICSPLGLFASTDVNQPGAGFATPGIASELNFSRRIRYSKWAAAGAMKGSLFLSDNQNLSSGSSVLVYREVYSMSSILIGAEKRKQLTAREALTTRFMFGYAVATKPLLEMTSSTAWLKEEEKISSTFTYAFGVGLVSTIKKNVKLFGNLDYQHAKPYFANIKTTTSNGSRYIDSWYQPMNSLSITVGLGLGF